MWGISILADFRPGLWGISFQAVVFFGLGKNLLFKSVLGHCRMYGFDAWYNVGPLHPYYLILMAYFLYLLKNIVQNDCKLKIIAPIVKY